MALCTVMCAALWIGTPEHWAFVTEAASWAGEGMGIVLGEVRLGLADLMQLASPRPWLEQLSAQTQWWPAAALGIGVVTVYFAAAFYRQEVSHAH